MWTPVQVSNHVRYKGYQETYKTLELVWKLYEHADRLYPGYTTAGNHVTNSLHYRGQAIDFDSGTSPKTIAALKRDNVSRYTAMTNFAAHLYGMSSMIAELFSTDMGHTHGHYVKNGRRQSYDWARANGLTTFAESVDHIHCGVGSWAAVDGMLIVSVQRALGLTQDGYYGPKTEEAVKALQRKSHITPDGVPGPATVDAIRYSRGWPSV
jgi:peptidoglycan hydrolase-like protein with peptidoglycan-binding domain